LLGQGEKTRESKTFKKIELPADVVIDKISIKYDHAMAQDEAGKLWAWGSNLQHRCGIPDEIMDGIFKPTRVHCLDSEVFRVTDVSAGLDHSLI